MKSFLPQLLIFLFVMNSQNISWCLSTEPYPRYYVLFFKAIWLKVPITFPTLTDVVCFNFSDSRTKGWFICLISFISSSLIIVNYCRKWTILYFSLLWILRTFLKKRRVLHSTNFYILHFVELKLFLLARLGFYFALCTVRMIMFGRLWHLMYLQILSQEKKIQHSLSDLHPSET